MKPLVAPRTERNLFFHRSAGGEAKQSGGLFWRGEPSPGGSPVPPGTPNSSRQLVRAFSFISRYQLWQNPAGGGGIFRIQAPFCLLRRHSPVRGITPPLRIEKPFGRAEKKKSLQPTCPYLQCGSPHRDSVPAPRAKSFYHTQSPKKRTLEALFVCKFCRKLYHCFQKTEHLFFFGKERCL